jgi:hypothetical protein
VIVHAQGAAGANNCRLDWQLDFDDVARTLTVTATHTHFDGSPAPAPQVAGITLELATGQARSFDFLTVPAPSDGQPGVLNKGVQVFTNISLKIGAGRGQVLSYTTNYLPPAG